MNGSAAVLLGFCVLFALATGTGCDGSLRVEGAVLKASTREPVPAARVWMADRVMNQGLDRYLEVDDAAFEGRIDTGVDGRFVAVETIAGPGSHDVWIVIQADGYRELRERVWSGRGLPDRAPRSLQFELIPAEAQSAP